MAASIDPMALLMKFLQQYEQTQLPPDVREKIIQFGLRDLVVPEVNDITGLEIPYKYVKDVSGALHKEKGPIKEAVIAAIKAALAAYFAAVKVTHDAFPGGLVPAIEGVLHQAEGASPHSTRAAHHSAHDPRPINLTTDPRSIPRTHPYQTQHAAQPGHEHHYTPEHGAAPNQTQFLGIDPLSLLMKFLQKYEDGSVPLPNDVREKIIQFGLRDIVLPEVNDLTGLEIPYKYVKDYSAALHKERGPIKEAVIAAIKAGLAAYFAAVKVTQDAFPGGLVPAIEGVLRQAEGASPHSTRAAHHSAYPHQSWTQSPSYSGVRP